jgi:hypothetical protein
MYLEPQEIVDFVAKLQHAEASDKRNNTPFANKAKNTQHTAQLDSIASNFTKKLSTLSFDRLEKDGRPKKSLPFTTREPNGHGV